MADPRDEIARLEAKIERLSVSAERCRKIALFAKVTIAAGLVLLAAILLGFVHADGLSLMVAAILSMGGIVLFGSNDTTAKQTAESIAQAEQLRAELIGAIDLTLVPEQARLLH
jgi:hypothetical protein